MVGSLAVTLLLQGAVAPVAVPGPLPVRELRTAESYEQAYDEVMALRPRADRVAAVENLVIQRDTGRFVLQQGSVVLLTPVGGRTVAAVFSGKGSFSFAPPSGTERDRLARLEHTGTLDAPITSAVFFFTDTTVAQLERTLEFRPGTVPSDGRKQVQDALELLGDDDSRTIDPDLMAALLNGEESDLFYAYIRRQSGGPLLFMLNPNEVESVRLAGKVTRAIRSRSTDLINQFPRQGLVRQPGVSGERTRTADIRHYTIETWLPQTGIGEIDFRAAARVEIVADTLVGPWIVFQLFEKLKVDSARWEGGPPATIFRGKDSGLLWIRLDRRIGPGDTRALTLHYHGDLIDRYVDFFQIKSSAAWYPRSLEGRSLAKFDLTFHTSSAYLLASVGKRIESSGTGSDVRSRWVTDGPIRNASFNLGLFKDFSVEQPGVPPVTVMVSEEAHKKLAKVFSQQSRMRERVGDDVSRSLQFFQSVYGPAPVQRFYATEIPGFHGEAFPGMVHLSWVTFQQTSHDGDDEVFRAHEVAHQWWGIGVDFVSYHDQWLSEGFANFSGLWYLQTVSGKNDKYFAMLERWRSSILLREGEPGPISLGYRVLASKDLELDDYQTVVYKKGAWVMHMLRILMLDLSTMSDDRFKGMMRDFYASYQGRRASTDDFRRTVERHTRSDMGWFFDQWVNSTAIPTYRVAHRSEPAENGQVRVRLKVEQQGVPDDFQMYIPVTLDLGKDRVARLRVKVKGPVSEIALPLMPAEPKKIRFNDLSGVLAEVKTVGWN